MPIRFFANEGGAVKEHWIKPTPFISISKQLDKTGDGTIIGATYSITLTGTLLSERGSPDSAGLFYGTDAWTDKYTGGDTDSNEALAANLKMKSLQKKQQVLRNLFSSTNQIDREIDDAKEELGKMQVNPLDGSVGFSFYPRFVSIDFSEGNWVNRVDYTISLEADHIWYGGTITKANFRDEDLFDWSISAASEDWSIEEGDAVTLVFSTAVGGAGDAEPTEKGVGGTGYMRPLKTYNLTHTMSATGKPRYRGKDGEILGEAATAGKGGYGGEAWQQASGYLYTQIGNYQQAWQNVDDTTGGQKRHGMGMGAAQDTRDFFDPLYMLGTNLPQYYRPFNYQRNQSVNKTDGSMNITETWVLASGHQFGAAGAANGWQHTPVTEECDVSVDESNGLITCSINGTVTGLNGDVRFASAGALGFDPLRDGYHFGTGRQTEDPSAYGTGRGDNTPAMPGSGNLFDLTLDKFQNAQKRFYGTGLPKDVSGIEAQLHDRAMILAKRAFNPVPVSKSVSSNPVAGTISYTYQFDTRPTNLIPGTIMENVSIQDTYPSHVAAITQVIGRRTGPVIQDIGTQTEYRRSLTIDCVVSGVNFGRDDMSSGQYGRTQYKAFVDTPVAGGWVDGGAAVGGGAADINPATTRNIKRRGSVALALCHLKPSQVTHPYNQRDAILDIIYGAAPIAGGTDAAGVNRNISKAFVSSPPSESWNPKTGEWSYNIEWTYEVAFSDHPYHGSLIFTNSTNMQKTNTSMGLNL